MNTDRNLAYYSIKLQIELLKREIASSRRVFAAERRARQALAYSNEKIWLEAINSHIGPLLDDIEETAQAQEERELSLADLLESGIESHPEEMELDTNLNLDPKRCPHRMVSNSQLSADRRTSLYEQFCPCEAGPWSFVFEGEVIGYEGMSNSDTLMPDPWTALAMGHVEEQRALDQVERTVGRALIQDRVKFRSLLAEKILAWVQTADIKKVRASKRRFWLWVLASRQACAAAGLWHEVCLTKAQVTDIFAAYDSRLK